MDCNGQQEVVGGSFGERRPGAEGRRATAIEVTCRNCGKSFRVKDEYTGKGGSALPATASSRSPPLSHRRLSSRGGHGAARLAPAARQAGPMSMKCEECGGAVEYKSTEGPCKCKYCGSVYEAAVDNAGQAVVRTIHIVTQKEHLCPTRGAEAH